MTYPLTYYAGVIERKIRSGKSRDYRDAIVFEKLRFQNVYRPDTKAKSWRFQIPAVEKNVLEKLRFSEGISVDGKLNRRKKNYTFKFFRRSVVGTLSFHLEQKKNS